MILDLSFSNIIAHTLAINLAHSLWLFRRKTHTLYLISSMDFDSFFVLGDSGAHGDIFDFGQSEDINLSTDFDWLPTTAAHLGSHLGPEIPHDRTLVSPDDTALTMMDYQVQLNHDSNMTDAGLFYEDQTTSADWNNSDTIGIQDFDLTVAHSSSILTEEERHSTTRQHLAHTGPSPQTGEPSMAANHHLDRTKASSAKHTSSEDWAKHRGLITSLYEKMTLPKVMRHMEQEEGFSAT